MENQVYHISIKPFTNLSMKRSKHHCLHTFLQTLCTWRISRFIRWAAEMDESSLADTGLSSLRATDLAISTHNGYTALLKFRSHRERERETAFGYLFFLKTIRHCFAFIQNPLRLQRLRA